MATRDFDVVLHGATGFVGRLVAQHLAQYAGPSRVALSGRSKDRLLALRDELGVAWPIILSDASDPGSLAAMAQLTKVVATTVGPYSQYGLPLVLACADAGTSYADLNGELSFARAAAQAAHARAAKSGARIVLSAGFESIPSDLGVLLLHEQAALDGQGTLEDTTGVVVSLRAGMSGGAADSYRAELDLVRSDPAIAQWLADPYVLSPERADDPAPGPELDSRLPRRDALLGRWVAPFMTGPYNARIVRRSNALTGHSYGPGFRYREVMGVGESAAAPVVAGAVAAGVIALEVAFSRRPTRALLDRLLPQPGSGPSEKARQAGHFRFEVHTRTSTGARYVATIAAQGDPGYTATTIMFGESALCLASDPLTSPGGVLTPAVAMGDRLVDRLHGHGLQLSVARID